jgi:putative phosphoribosyl transferase
MNRLFKDRNDAAQKLLFHLKKYSAEQGVILAVPRGGVPIAYPIAKEYNFPLELLMTKKIGHPAHSEFAIGAVSLEDHIVDRRIEIPQSYIDNEIIRIRKNLRERYRYFMGKHVPLELENKIVIIVDDGIATGNTILSALKMLRKKNPKKIIVAVPLAPAQIIEKIRKEVDEVICLHSPEPFIGVGLHYENFTEVSDSEVIRLLNDANHFEDVA